MKFVEDSIKNALRKVIVDLNLILLAYMHITSQGSLFFFSFVLFSSGHCHLTFLPSLYTTFLKFLYLSIISWPDYLLTSISN